MRQLLQHHHAILSSILIVILFNSCCKSNKCQCKKEWGYKVEDCTPIHYGPYYLGEVKDYLYFKPGSWWVYRNSLSGEIDSIYTVYCDTFEVKLKGEDERWLTITYTDIAFQTRSDVYDIVYKYFKYPYYPRQMTNNNDNFRYAQGLWRSRVGNSGSGPYIIFKHPFPDQNVLDYYEYYDSLNINGFNYPNVAVFQSDHFDGTIQIPENLPYSASHAGANKYYWSKGFGLVMTECLIFNKQTQSITTQKWELIKHHLIQ